MTLATGSGSATDSGRGTPESAGHPTWRFYVMVGLILTAITAAEVAVFYIPAMHSVLVPLLLTLSSGKFALVVMFYMHLRFDSPVFSGVFMAPLALAILVIVALVILFHVFPHGIEPLAG
ncbi:MAG: cytochrome C oxidase subunit IV family protein [Gemmatimonadales bacterium]|jgi:cytochrome c oxidase subunit 4